MPILPLGDQLILVETFMDYAPVWSIGIEAQTYDYFVFTRPRFAQIKYENKDNGVCPTE